MSRRSYSNLKAGIIYTVDQLNDPLKRNIKGALPWVQYAMLERVADGALRERCAGQTCFNGIIMMFELMEDAVLWRMTTAG